MKWKHFARYWPFVRGIHRSPVNLPHKGQWRGALKFSLICAWTNTLANSGDTGYLKRHRAHYDVIAMYHSTVFVHNDFHSPLCNSMRLTNCHCQETVCEIIGEYVCVSVLIWRKCGFLWYYLYGTIHCGYSSVCVCLGGGGGGGGGGS